MPHQSDAQLLAAFTAGNHDAFRALAERYTPLIYATARRQAPPYLAEDITQAVFLLLAQQAPTLRNPHLLPSWLLKVTRYCAADARRSHQRRKRHEHKAAIMATTLITDPPPPEDDPLHQHLDAALHALSPESRTAILLRYYNNQPLAEVAAALSLSQDAAKKRIHRALEKLRKILLRKNLPLSAAILTAAFARQAHAASPTLAAKVATLALTKSAAPAAALLIAKGATKLMAYTTAKLAVATTVGVVLIAAGTAEFVRHSRPSQLPTGPLAAPVPVALGAPATATIQRTPSILALSSDPVPTIEVRDLANNAPLAGVTLPFNPLSPMVRPSWPRRLPSPSPPPMATFNSPTRPPPMQ